MPYVEVVEPRRLFSTVVPGTLSLYEPDLGPKVRVGQNSESNGQFLGWTHPGQKIEFQIDVQTTGEYVLSFTAATNVGGSSLHFNLDSKKNVTGSIKIPNTHNWYAWETVTSSKPLELTAGSHLLVMVINTGSPNFQTATITPQQIPDAPTLTTAPPPIAGNWSEIFSDDFGGNSLGPAWTPHQYWSDGPTVGEGLETSDPANVSVSNGTLQLTAEPNNSFGTPYTGALVQTGGIEGNSSQPTFSFQYGYAQATILIPAGSGLWPAFWMLPASHHDNNGEIDVMEMYDSDTTSVYGTIHKNGAQQQHANHTGVDLSAGWHTFAVDWEPDHITWYLDGVPYATTTSKSLIPTVPMFPIFDLAVGGRGNSPDADTPFPATMEVSSIEVWQLQ